MGLPMFLVLRDGDLVAVPGRGAACRGGGVAVARPPDPAPIGADRNGRSLDDEQSPAQMGPSRDETDASEVVCAL
jgi:hypothetical protein